MIKFTPYDGDLMGLVANGNHLVFKWSNDSCKVLFSVTKKGSAASCHFASDKKGLRLIRRAIDEFCAFVFSNLNWCKMIIAAINKPSVCRIVEKVGFFHIGNAENCKIYIRVNHG